MNKQDIREKAFGCLVIGIFLFCCFSFGFLIVVNKKLTEVEFIGILIANLICSILPSILMLQFLREKK